MTSPALVEATTPASSPSGQLKIAENETEFDDCRARVARLNALGFTHEVLRRCERRARARAEPVAARGGRHLGRARRLRAAVSRRDRRSGRAAERRGRRGSRAVRRASLRRQHGPWEIEAGNHVWRAPRVVNAAGAWAGNFARQAGELVPVEPRGLMLMVTQAVPAFIVKPVLGATGRPLSFKQFPQRDGRDRRRAGCAPNMRERRCDIDFSRLGESARTVTDLFPHLRQVAVNRAWAGIEAFMPDGIPVISCSGTQAGLVHAFGFSAHGFELAPAVGSVIAQLRVRRPQPAGGRCLSRWGAARPRRREQCSLLSASSLYQPCQIKSMTDIQRFETNPRLSRIVIH